MHRGKGDGTFGRKSSRARAFSSCIKGPKGLLSCTLLRQDSRGDSSGRRFIILDAFVLFVIRFSFDYSMIDLEIILGTPKRYFIHYT